MKEPNGVLVMTTCKCRENANNLVMTRSYFDDILRLKVAFGATQEQKRIIELLEDKLGSTSETPISDVIAAIKADA